MNAGSPPSPQSAPEGSAALGVGLALAMLVFIAPLVYLMALVAQAFDLGLYDTAFILVLAPLMFPGAVQYLWIVPVALWFRRQGKTDTSNAMWITSGVILLLNGACHGLVALT